MNKRKFGTRKSSCRNRRPENKYKAIFDNANDGIFIHDLVTGQFVDVNTKACEIYGCNREELLRSDFFAIATGDHPYSGAEIRQWLSLAAEGSPQLFEWLCNPKDGVNLWLEISLRRVFIGIEELIVGVVRDITERKHVEEELRRKTEENEHLAYNDLLTGLPNRFRITRWLDQELVKARKQQTAGALMFIDMDNLKTVNDTFGHSAGDAVIITAATYIVAAVDEKALVARISGDEFIVLLPGANDKRLVAEIAEEIVVSLAREYDVYGEHFHMSASVGVALYPADGATPEEILKNADTALYAAKRNGKAGWQFYHADMNKGAYEKMVMESNLRRALDNGEFSLRYQPQLSLAGSVKGFEALLRWKSPQYGMVSPAEFIPLAEETRLIISIGRWVLNESCRFARKLKDAGFGKLQVAVNVSPIQLEDPNFLPNVELAIRNAGISPAMIEIEITESVIIEGMVDSVRKLDKLREMGIGLALDDFGRGYASLGYLQILPTNTLKIDKIFVDLITTDPRKASLIGSIINMAHALDMSVVAEGVEQEAQLAHLASCGCDFVQGYLFSVPLLEADAMHFLQTKSAV